MGICRSCVAERDRKRRKEFPDAVKVCVRNWKRNNQQHVKDYMKEYMKDYCVNNKQRLRDSRIKYRKTEAFKKSKRIQRRVRRMRKKSLLHYNHNRKIELILQDMRDRISTCLGIGFDLDHVYPISLGGPHYHKNLQVIPSTINLEKSNSLEFRHETLTHWTELDADVIRWIDNNTVCI